MDEGRFILLLIKINKEEKCAVVREVIVRSKFRSVAPPRRLVCSVATLKTKAHCLSLGQNMIDTVSRSTKIYSKAIRGLV